MQSVHISTKQLIHEYQCEINGDRVFHSHSVSCTALSNHTKTNISIQISLRQIGCESFYDTLN
jgi:ribulose-5-phosphate 4-epimerase/fuculose-1-phosphate aldolase